MDKTQLINTFILVSLSNIFVKLLLQNNVIYFILLLSLIIGCIILGIFSENKFNIIKKINNFDIKKISKTLNDSNNTSSNLELNQTLDDSNNTNSDEEPSQTLSDSNNTNPNDTNKTSNYGSYYNN